jgi:hypothetical protein
MEVALHTQCKIATRVPLSRCSVGTGVFLFFLFRRLRGSRISQEKISEEHVQHPWYLYPEVLHLNILFYIMAKENIFGKLPYTVDRRE